jgi:hypothetical protein
MPALHFSAFSLSTDNLVWGGGGGEGTSFEGIPGFLHVCVIDIIYIYTKLHLKGFRLHCCVCVK